MELYCEPGSYILIKTPFRLFIVQFLYIKESDMIRLFETSEINGMKLSNRFVRSATWEGMATDDGACTPKLRALMADLA